MSLRRSEFLDLIMATLIKHGIYNKAVLKGGYLLNKLMGLRGTSDIDFSFGKQDDWKIIRDKLNSCGNDLIELGILEEFSIREPIAGKRSGGLIMTRIDGYKFKLDISLQPLHYGIVMERIVLRDGAGMEIPVDIPAYTMERVLADKISATFSSKQFRRVKDLYDIYSITSLFDINIYEMYVALKERKFNPDVDTSPFKEDAIVKWNQAWNKFNLSDMNENALIKPDVMEMLRQYSIFIVDYMQLVDSGNMDYYWNHNKRSWQREGLR